MQGSLDFLGAHSLVGESIVLSTPDVFEIQK